MGKNRETQAANFQASFLNNQITFNGEYDAQDRLTGVRGVNLTTDKRGQFYVWQGPISTPTARWPQSGAASLEPGQNVLFNTPPGIDPDEWNWTFYAINV